MAGPDLLSAIDFLKQEGVGVLRSFARSNPATTHADLRLEVVFSRSSAASDGEARGNVESLTANLGVNVWVRARHGPVRARNGARAYIGCGFSGSEIGRLARDRTRLVASVRGALGDGFERARANARGAAALVKSVGRERVNLVEADASEPPSLSDDVAAVFRRDPRTLDPAELKRLCQEASAAAKAIAGVAYNWVGAFSELRHELFLSAAGARISQAFAFSQGDCYVVAQGGDGHQEIYDTIGQQRGLECLAEGSEGGLMPNQELRAFVVALAREAVELSCVPVLSPTESEVTVVTDPHFNALLAHEVVGHPCEADRALKMEAAYAGRSWFLRSRDDNEIGRRVGSPLVSACSDPELPGYGFYRYDHEGTPARRVMHIEDGVFRGFLNSRATAAALGAEPNGSARASEAFHVPLVRMSNTFFLPGRRAPEEIVGEVERGYLVSGSAIPSIAESRENFRISARRVYEIDHGRIGRLYRAGSVIADSKRFFMNVDAVGNDLRLVAVPNCGKGQPMQVKRMSNGGPTMRSRARLGGGG